MLQTYSISKRIGAGILIAALAAAILSVGCSRIENKISNDRQKFIDIYVDLTVAYWQSEGKTNNYQSLAAAVFEKYDVDKTFMIKTQKKFENDIKLQLGIYQEIVDRLKNFENISQDSLQQVIEKTIDTR